MKRSPEDYGGTAYGATLIHIVLTVAGAKLRKSRTPNPVVRLVILPEWLVPWNMSVSISLARYDQQGKEIAISFPSLITSVDG